MSFELEPIQGQPGLFRYKQRDLTLSGTEDPITPPAFATGCCGEDLPNRQWMPPLPLRLGSTGMFAGSIEEQIYQASEWSKASLQVTPETPLSPVFQQNLRGFAGAMETSRIDEARRQYDEIKTRLQRVLDTYAAPLDGARYATLVQQITALPRDAMARISSQDVVVLIKAAMLVANNSILLAQAINNGPRAAEYATRTNALVNAAKGTLFALDQVIGALETVESAADRAARAIGLRGDLGLAPAVVVGLIVGGTVAFVVGATLLYFLASNVYANYITYRDASEACQRDAAAGNPCTGSDWASYANDAADRERRMGTLPDVSDAFSRLGEGIGSGLKWGLIAAAVGLVGYGIWTTKPAAEVARRRLASGAERAGT